MNKWTGIRSTIVALSFIGALSQGSASTDAIDWKMLIASLFLTPLGLLFVIGIQYLNSRSAPVWRYPQWSINPFTIKEPLQLFHLVGYVFSAGGIGYITRSALNSMPVTLEGLIWITTGVGLLLGVRLCLIAFRSKMSREHQTQ